MSSPGTARRLWALGEPFHALIYFADECRGAGAAAGLTGFWQTYFAFRAAPLGAVGPAVVTATFYNFAPSFVDRRVPAVWAATSPAGALDARLAGIDGAVRRVLGEDWPGSAEAAEAADLARTAAAATDLPGRPLAAANTAVPMPADPHLALWQALTTLREHRGDGHNAALLQREVDGVSAHVLAVAAGRSTREALLRARGWDDAAWDDAVERLTAAGLAGRRRAERRGAGHGRRDRGRHRPPGAAAVAGARRSRLRPARGAADADPSRRRRGRGLAGGQPDRRSRTRVSGHCHRP